ncbi:DNA polymerase [Klebsiella phage YMC16/01/N133_KPN_BP]|uniref:DNA-directed DNA polymerase family A palm domain-containing protein n=1 Tax=Klebsiella phage YMC16/01/N133_KPN_BP TaxID=2026102 RepID=A0A248XD70_9CAUD|nr:DNA polymerase [Klebsiella phage YMC16/01/N133_KPN_BP]ASW27622.1 hypothetical protein KPNN133_003 [Klebsiella phage YMC16/01/N133_KPN_BP]
MAAEKIHLDYESRSTLPFGKQGGVTTYQYSRHPTTEILLASYKIGSDPIERWRRGQPLPKRLREAVGDGLKLCAHNFAFEWAMWNNIWVPRLGAPVLPFSQGDCTAVRASVLALPRSLSEACKALGLSVRKDEEGAKVMLKMAKPRKARKDEDPDSIWWWDTPELMDRLHDYCDIDVEVEYALDQVLPELTEDEWQLWQMDHRTNQRGVLLDMPFIHKAKRLMAVSERHYNNELSKITGGEVKAVTEVGPLRNWVNDNSELALPSFDKTQVENALKDPDVPDDVRRVLEIRQEAGKSSVAKYTKFELLAYLDNVMRENFLHHGANTGRSAGKGAQLQNLPSRGGLKWYQAVEVIKMVMETDDPEWAFQRIEMIYGGVPEALSSCLRLCIIARPGKKLYVADFSNIEGRVAAWLGGEKWKLEAFKLYDTPLLDEHGQKIPDPDTEFKRKGPDLYKVTAAQILGTTPDIINKVQRNVMGKVPELALGFGGGVGAFQSMAKIYNVNMADYWDIVRTSLDQRFVDKAFDNWESFGKKSGIPQDEWLASETVKLAWRARHPGIVRCWRDAEECAVKALKTPGKWFKFAGGKCAFGAKKIGEKMFLISRLPNGRRVYRCDAHLKTVKKFGRMVDEIRFMGVDSVTKQWVRMSTYGGDLFQTFVQAIARDIMKDGMANVEAADFDPILEVHDEVGSEGDEDRDLHEYENLMATLKPCYDGCPVSALGYVADRYRKD